MNLHIFKPLVHRSAFRDRNKLRVFMNKQTNYQYSMSHPARTEQEMSDKIVKPWQLIRHLVHVPFPPQSTE